MRRVTDLIIQNLNSLNVLIDAVIEADKSQIAEVRSAADKMKRQIVDLLVSEDTSDELYVSDNLSTGLPQLYLVNCIRMTADKNLVNSLLIGKNEFPLAVSTVESKTFEWYFNVLANLGVKTIHLIGESGTVALDIALFTEKLESRNSASAFDKNSTDNRNLAVLLTNFLQMSRRISPKDNSKENRKYEAMLLERIARLILKMEINIPLAEVVTEEQPSDFGTNVTGRGRIATLELVGVSANDESAKMEYCPVFTDVNLAAVLPVHTKWERYGRVKLWSFVRDMADRFEQRGGNGCVIVNPGTLNWIISENFIQIIREIEQRLQLEAAQVEKAQQPSAGSNHTDGSTDNGAADDTVNNSENPKEEI